MDLLLGLFAEERFEEGEYDGEERRRCNSNEQKSCNSNEHTNVGPVTVTNVRVTTTNIRVTGCKRNERQQDGTVTATKKIITAL